MPLPTPLLLEEAQAIVLLPQISCGYIDWSQPPELG